MFMSLLVNRFLKVRYRKFPEKCELINLEYIHINKYIYVYAHFVCIVA